MWARKKFDNFIAKGQYICGILKFSPITVISETMKKAILEDSKILTVTREGNSSHYKTHIGDADVDFAEKIREQTISTFKDGVWAPVEQGDAKRYIIKLTRHEDEIYEDLNIPDVPGVTSRRLWKKC